MTIELELTPHVEAELLAQARAAGLSLEEYAARLLQDRIRQTTAPATDLSVATAARHLATFGKRHGLSLGDLSIKELIRESRP